jgi:hypothetical protein
LPVCEGKTTRTTSDLIPLSIVQEQGSSDGNPVEDLTEIMLDCYELLSTISQNYTLTGNDRHDNSVNRLKILFQNWPASEADELRDSSFDERRKPTNERLPPPCPTIFEAPEPERETALGTELDEASEDRDTDTEKVPPSVSNRSSAPSVPPPRPPSAGASASAGASVTKPVGKSASTPCLPAARGSEEGKGDKSSKNNDYFLKLKEVRYRYIVVYKL